MFISQNTESLLVVIAGKVVIFGALRGRGDSGAMALSQGGGQRQSEGEDG